MKLKPIPNKKQREWMEKHKKKDKSILDYGKKQITQIRAKLRELSRYMPQKKECRDAAIHPTERGPKRGGEKNTFAENVDSYFQ